MKQVVLFFVIFLSVSSCIREEDIPLAEPGIVLLDAGEQTREPGKIASFEAMVQSLAGLKTLHITVNGNIAETVDLGGKITFVHSFSYKIPDNQAIGSQLKVEFVLEDNDGRTARTETSILVDQPYTVDEITLEGHTYSRIKGLLNRDFRLTADKNWLMDSVVSVDEAAVLTIEAGTTVYFRAYPGENKTSLLAIAQGSRVVAQGSLEKPVVFTSHRQKSGAARVGDWGGLLMNGSAPTNRAATVLEDGFRYGGTQVGDHSGVLQYVRIEYAGKGEYHGLHLHGVGSATQVSHVQVLRCYNSAFRVRGGRVSLKYIAGIEHGGYGIWADEGWQGNGQFWLFQTSVTATLVPVNYWNQARSIEFRSDASLPERQPRTTFNVSNVTLIGNGFTGNSSDGTRRGVRVRQGAMGRLHNFIITGFPDEGIRVEDLPLSDLGNTTTISHMHVYGNRVNWGQEADSFFFKSGNYHLSETPVTGIALKKFDAVAPGGINSGTLGSWFTPVSYIGAVDPANDWTKGGEWFSN